MAVIGNTAITYADWAKRLEDDKIAAIVELLSQTNEILIDMLVIEGNLTTGHKSTIRTGLPSSTWRLLNYGVPVSKSTTAQVVDTCGNLEAESQIDRDIVALNGNTPEFRLSESRAFMESMNQTMASTLFYGNTSVNPERFTGLSPRYNSVVTSTAQTANNVLDAGGTGSTNTSAWIIVWGQDTVTGMFPKGKRAGLLHEDMGEWRVYDAVGNPYYAWVDHYKWECGLVVRDWRYAVRIANIDVSLLNGGSAANLINLFIRALRKLPTGSANYTPVQNSDAPTIQGPMGQCVIYCNRTVSTYMDLQALNKSNVLLNMDQFGGKPVTTFRGIPIRTCDALLNTEARVV